MVRVWLTFVVVFFGCRSESKSSTASREPAKPAVTAPADAAPVVPGDWWSAQLALDTGTAYLSASSFAVRADPPEALWSYLAFVVCQEDDPFGSFVALGAAARLPSDTEGVRAGLRCGRAVAARIPPASRTHVIELDPASAPRPMPISVVPTTFANISELAPELRGFRREMLGTDEVLCRPFDPTEQTCAERANEYDKALAWKGGYLLSGPFVAIQRVLAWPNAARVLAALGGVPKQFTDDDLSIELDVLAPETRWTIGPRRWLPYTEGADAFATVVRTQARAVGWERSQTKGAIVLAPRCSTDACSERDALLAALGEYHAAWKTSAPGRLNRLLAEDLGPATDCARPEEEALVKAIARAEVTRTPAGLVELRYAVDDKERASEVAACTARKQEATAGATARVRALLDGR